MQVHFIVAACENMISGTGMRPGDVITASNGKTIEVIFASYRLVMYLFLVISTVMDGVDLVFLYQ